MTELLCLAVIGVILLAVFIPVRQTPPPTNLQTIIPVNSEPLHDNFLASHQSQSTSISLGELHHRLASLEIEMKQLKRDIDE